MERECVCVCVCVRERQEMRVSLVTGVREQNVRVETEKDACSD